MTITPKQNVTINGLTYTANHTFEVNYTTFTKMLLAGAMNEPVVFESTTTADDQVDETKFESNPAVKSSRRRTRKK